MKRPAASPGQTPEPTLRAPARLLWSSLLVFVGGCGDGTLGECRKLAEEERHGEAAVICAEAYRESRDPEAGYAAARAQVLLGRHEEALAWRDRLEGTAVEARWLGLEAYVHDRRGDVDRALDGFERQLELHRAAGSHALAADSAQWLFHLSWKISRYRDALEFAGLAYEEAVAAGHRDKQLDAMEALSTVLYEVGDLDGAQRIFDRLDELVDPGDRARRNRLLVNQGLVRLAEGRTALARRAFRRALELADAENRRFHRATHVNLVKTELIRGDLDAAEHHLQRVWDYVEPEGSPPTALLTYRARVDLARGRYREAADAVATALEADPVADWAWVLELENGRIAEATGDLEAAEAAYARAAEIVEELRRSLALDELKAWLLDKKREPLERLFRLQVNSGRATDALVTAERAQARAFLDAFVRAADAGAAVGEAGSSAPVERLEALQELLPTMSYSPVVALAPIEDVLAQVVDRHLLLYFEAGDELWLLEVRNRRVVPHRLAATPRETEDLVEDFLAGVGDPVAAGDLARLLLPPGSLPPQGSTVQVAASEALEGLPFGALRFEGRYLIEDYVVVYVPGANALAAIAGRPRGPYDPPVVLADAGGDLPAAKAEAEATAARLGVAAHTGTAATAAELRRGANARLLHLAIHTGVGPRGPWLALADGRVSAGEIVSGGLAPRLVVLASCASAARRSPAAWASLGGAFLAAGSEAVLASLGSIEDRSARRFVDRFYREGGARQPSRALARAQRAFITAGEPPEMWAPFVLLGVDRPSPEAARSAGENR